MITNFKVIEYFKTKNGNEYGIYSANFNNEKKFFVQNGDSFGVICYFLNESVSKCLCIVTDNVKAELKDYIEKISKL